jgi:uncharacterized protein YjbI with pentapeptide repeats
MKVTGTDGKEYTIEPEASLSEANLNSADLRWANLRDANLTGADLSGAVWNNDTVFPEGFEIPEKSGT